MADLYPEIVDTELGPIEVAIVDPPSGRTKVALLGIHGTPGDYRQARSLPEDFADRITVLLPTRPGYGKTPLKVGRTAEEQGNAFAALLDALDIKYVVVVGISGGGPSAYSFAAEHPDRCSGLVLCCAAVPSLVEVPSLERKLIAIPGLWSLVSRFARRTATKQLRDDVALRAEMVSTLLPAEKERLDSDPRLEPGLLQFAHDRAASLSGRGMRNDFRRGLGAAMPYLPGEVITAITPTVVIHGTDDPVVSIEHARHHHEVIPGSELIELEGFGHAIPATARAEVTAAIEKVLEAARV